MGRHQACADCSKFDNWENPSYPRCEIYGVAHPAHETCEWDDANQCFVYQPFRARRRPDRIPEIGRIDE